MFTEFFVHCLYCIRIVFYLFIHCFQNDRRPPAGFQHTSIVSSKIQGRPVLGSHVGLPCPALRRNHGHVASQGKVSGSCHVKDRYCYPWPFTLLIYLYV